MGWSYAYGQLDVLPWRDTYLPDGRFDKRRMLAAIEEMLNAGASQGYDRTRLVAHPQWGAQGLPRTIDWVEYEMSLNEMLEQHEDVVVCTYDREALEPERVVDALRSHPMLLIGGVLLENPFYVPPVELLTRLREKDAEQVRLRELEAAARIQRGLMGMVTSLELAPDGSGYRMHTRFAKFINLPELLTMFRTVGDVQTADMLNLPRPELESGRPTVVAAPASPELKEFIRTLTVRAEKLKKERVDPSVDNMLKITGEGRKAALDMRLVQPGVEPPPDSKIDRAVSRIVKIWSDTRNERSTQLVFSDLSTPDPERFNVYADIRSKLVAAGVPPKEIAFIHDAETDTAKKMLFDGVNAGRVRILLGSTEKMGAGTTSSAVSLPFIISMRHGAHETSSSGKGESCAKATRTRKCRSTAT